MIDALVIVNHRENLDSIKRTRSLMTSRKEGALGGILSALLMGGQVGYSSTSSFRESLETLHAPRHSEMEYFLLQSQQ